MNTYNDRFQSATLFSNSLVDAMAVGISIVIAMMTVIGRVGPLELLLLTLLGTLTGEINNQLLWRLFVTDSGYGMRIFAFGGALGVSTAVAFWNKSSTENHDGYCTNYFSQTYSLLGMIFAWIFFPALIIADLYHVTPTTLGAVTLFTSTDNIIIGSAVLNVIFSMVSSVIGAFSAAILFNKSRKIPVHDIIFGTLSVIFVLSLGPYCIFFDRRCTFQPCFAFRRRNSIWIFDSDISSLFKEETKQRRSS